jgi:DNA polymerase-1
LPPIVDQAPSWETGAALARDWELNRLAQRLEDLAKAEAL